MMKKSAGHDDRDAFVRVVGMGDTTLPDGRGPRHTNHESHRVLHART